MIKIKTIKFNYHIHAIYIPNINIKTEEDKILWKTDLNTLIIYMPIIFMLNTRVWILTIIYYEE